MKITINQYAKALYDATNEKPQEEIEGMISNFLKVLKKNNQMKLARKVMEKFSDIHDAKNGIVQVEVTSVSKLDEKVLSKVENFVANKYGAKKVILKNKIDEKIKGGIILRVGDEMMDSSVSRKLEELGRILVR